MTRGTSDAPSVCLGSMPPIPDGDAGLVERNGLAESEFLYVRLAIECFVRFL